MGIHATDCCNSIDKVTKMYKDLQVETKDNKCYSDAWDLRRLYSFSLRRQKDSEKRGQVPRASRGSFPLYYVSYMFFE